MSQRLGETKALILESCITPKSWSELIEITRKSDPTLMVHLNDLKDRMYLEKKDDGHYQTTDDGIKILRLVASYRPVGPAASPYIESTNLMLLGLGKNLEWRDRLLKTVSELVVRGYIDKTSGAFYNAIGEALRSSVTLWMPSPVKIDPDMFIKINDIISEAIKQNAVLSPDGKLRIIIDVDFPKQLELRIREEKNPKVKEQLIANQKKITTDVVKNWHRLFDYTWAFRRPR